ncbi:hypothetical protein MKX54_14045 [Alkalihalobacillus sp. FSL R5-0424]
MDLVNELKGQYGWKHAKIIGEDLIETDHGLKRMRQWDDQDLLNWHINWRDHCTRAPIVLTDRMIRTKDKDAYLSLNSSWTTIHDEVTEPFVYKENGQVWGTLIGLMIEYGLKAETDINRTKREAPNLFTLEKKIWRFPESVQPTLRNMVHEGKRRLKKAAAIQSKYAEEEKLPLLDPLQLAGQAGSVHGMLHWNGGTDYPEEGYASLSQWLKNLSAELETEEIEMGLNHINEVYPAFSELQARLLLAECLIPYELEAISQIDPRVLSEETLHSMFVRCTDEWNRSKQIVERLADWLDRRDQSK